jgi:Cu/Ag efflux pump CusA
VAAAVAGGMFGGTILGLFVTPVMYAIIESLADRFRRKKPAEVPEPAAL